MIIKGIVWVLDPKTNKYQLSVFADNVGQEEADKIFEKMKKLTEELKQKND